MGSPPPPAGPLLTRVPHGEYQSIYVVQLKNTERRSLRIIGNNSLKLPSVENTIKCKSSQLVFEYLHYLQDNVCSLFNLSFGRLDHFKSTRNNGFSVKLPKGSLEFGKKFLLARSQAKQEKTVINNIR